MMHRKRHWVFSIERLTPAQVLGLGYFSVIVVGTLLLKLPIATRPGVELSVLDAAFTATSATCVTGLSVLNTATGFSRFGQTIIMILVQIGGLGIMTMSTLFALLLGKRIGIRQRQLIQEDLNNISVSGVVRMARLIIEIALIFEGIGAVILFLHWVGDMPAGRAFFFAVFHAISAFNNAGFDLFGTSLEGFVGDVVVNLVISFLIIAGGLGFFVLREATVKRRFRMLSLHSKIVLVSTLVLIAGAFIFVLVAEYHNPMTLGPLDPGAKVTAAFFQAVTPRTAGFNTVPVGQMRPVTLFFILLLMFIGASPGSTGGGIKTTTFACIMVAVGNSIKGQNDNVLFYRRISERTVRRSLSIMVLALALIVTVTMVLLAIEDLPILPVLFEVVSAFGTVGLSTGITPVLSGLGKLLIMMVMFAGRIGPVTLALALGRRLVAPEGDGVRYPEGPVVVG